MFLILLERKIFEIRIIKEVLCSLLLSGRFGSGWTLNESRMLRLVAVIALRLRVELVEET